MLFLKADTQTIVTIGPFVDVGDGFTPQTDITLAGNEAELLKHGSTTVVSIAAATWAAVTSCRGYYSLTLTTSHTDTEGQLTVIVQDDSDCLPVRADFMVVNANVYDSLFAAAGTDVLDVNATQWLGTAAATPTTAGVPEVDVTFWAGNAATASSGNPDVNVESMDSNVVSAAALAADAGTEIGTAVWATAARTLTASTNFNDIAATDIVSGGAITTSGGAVSNVTTTATNSDMRGTDNAALASVVGALADAAAAGDPTASDTLMQYAKQLINVLVGTAGVGTFPAEAAPANAVSLAEVIRAIHTDVTGLNGDAMRGTDSAALASVVGGLADAAAAGDPTSADTLMQYVKQLLNVLIGTAGVTTFPVEAAPANAVSLAEVIRAIHTDVTGLNGDAMRGTDSALLASSDGSGLTEAGGTGDQLSAIPWNAAWDAEVESEVNDALDTAISELTQAAPSATPTLRTGLMLLYMALRNRLDVNTNGDPDVLNIYNNAGTVIAKKQLTDATNDYSEAEMESGP